MANFISTALDNAVINHKIDEDIAEMQRDGTLELPLADQLEFAEVADQALAAELRDYYQSDFYEAITTKSVHAYSDGVRLPNQIFRVDGVVQSNDEVDLWWAFIQQVRRHFEIRGESSNPKIQARYEQTKLAIDDLQDKLFRNMYQGVPQTAVFSPDVFYILEIIVAKQLRDVALKPELRAALVYCFRELISARDNEGELLISTDQSNFNDLREDADFTSFAERCGISQEQLSHLNGKPFDYIDAGADRPTLVVYRDIHTELFVQFGITHDVALLDPEGIVGTESTEKFGKASDVVIMNESVVSQYLYTKSLLNDDENALVTLSGEIIQSQMKSISYLMELLYLMGSGDYLDTNDYAQTVNDYLKNQNPETLEKIRQRHKLALDQINGVVYDDLDITLKDYFKIFHSVGDEASLRQTYADSFQTIENALTQLAELSLPEEKSANDINATFITSMSSIEPQNTELLTDQIIRSQAEMLNLQGSVGSDLHIFSADNLFGYYPKFSNLNIIGHENPEWNYLGGLELELDDMLTQSLITAIRSRESFDNMAAVIADEKLDIAQMLIGAGHFDSLRMAALNRMNLNVIFIDAEPLDDVDVLNGVLSDDLGI